MPDSEIYMDYNATTPVDPRVLEAMLPCFSQNFGNASSRGHGRGRDAADLVEAARREVASLINCEPGELIFTSGATESANLALKGVYESYSAKGRHIITEQTAHSAVLNTCKHLEKLGAEVTFLPVLQDGRIDPAELSASLKPSTILVAVTAANNETGVLQPMEEISKLVHANDSLLFSDATQAVGKIPVDVNMPQVDLLALSAHKMYGPKGIGALFVRRKNPRVVLTPQMDGGGQEKGIRSGTLNVPGIVGLGKAALFCAMAMMDEMERVKKLRDLLETQLLKMEGAYLNGHTQLRLPNVTNIFFDGIHAAAVLQPLNRKLALSTGSACSTSHAAPSHVLLAMGRTETQAKSSLRFSLGRFTTEAEINTAAELIMTQIADYKGNIGNILTSSGE